MVLFALVVVAGSLAIALAANTLFLCRASAIAACGPGKVKTHKSGSFWPPDLSCYIECK